MNGYLRIKNTDLYKRDGVTYWRNGGNIIGNVVKAVIEENDLITSETYYIESLKTAKPIMLDPDVKIGGLTASESKNGNFIIVVTEPADFTEYGGGAGLKITFIYGVNYYSIETVESNGDIKIYDPDGESGTIGGKKKYAHFFRWYNNVRSICCVCFNETETMSTSEFKDYLKNHNFTGNTKSFPAWGGRYGDGAWSLVSGIYCGTGDKLTVYLYSGTGGEAYDLSGSSPTITNIEI